MNETSRDFGYFIDSSQERRLIRSRRSVKTADFSHELERGILNLFGGDGRIKVEKCFDIPAHSYDLNNRLNPAVLLTAEPRFLCRSFARRRHYVLWADRVFWKEARRWRA
jgi:hypothetical protein